MFRAGTPTSGLASAWIFPPSSLLEARSGAIFPSSGPRSRSGVGTGSDEASRSLSVCLVTAIIFVSPTHLVDAGEAANNLCFGHYHLFGLSSFPSCPSCPFLFSLAGEPCHRRVLPFLRYLFVPEKVARSQNLNV
ncbi:uncharacterized protein HMPREF1120_06108 [Exophiala dermatitidis NIH/UT8656]|uniref:Uncharacterized protein n=1 Tax=Exophiala dermatitidis (strain ATCC 34100 / CBS 525.76 / NIH/UT8656) TaxID=858893 RepID=H6C376_EXODN|nr:uncharacterized protein HMPREF1120_06108 [Exophiala dermatitidis NIH/UT8656]EHY58090.1 hypothetical protein HMPREF1120_06108 [Exophiala dermatitidis NIH/UT8656]